MEKLSPEELGQLVSRRRGSMGIRAAANEIDISPATLSRIERGHVPDLNTLTKICNWLKIDPARFLGTSPESVDESGAAVQIAFKKGRTLKPQTAKSLANLIMSAQKAFTEKIDAEGH